MCAYVRCTTVFKVGLTLGWKSKHSPGVRDKIFGFHRWLLTIMLGDFSFIRSNSDKLQIRQHMAQTFKNVNNKKLNVCLQSHHWLCTPLPKLITSDLCALGKLAFCKWTTHYCSPQRGTKSLSQTFTLTVPSWWNDLPNSIRAAESSSRIGWKHISSIFIWPSVHFLYSSHKAHSLTLALSNLIIFFTKKCTLFLY